MIGGVLLMQRDSGNDRCEGKFDDSGGERFCGSTTFGLTEGGTSVVVGGIAVITEFQRGISDGVPAATDGAIWSTERIGSVTVERAFITLLSLVSAGIAAEGRKKEDILFTQAFIGNTEFIRAARGIK